MARLSLRAGTQDRRTGFGQTHGTGAERDQAALMARRPNASATYALARPVGREERGESRRFNTGGCHPPYRRDDDGRCRWASLRSVQPTRAACIPPTGLMSAIVEAHRQVDGADVLGQCADGDAVDAGFGDGADAFEVDAAGDFQRDAAGGEGDGFAQHHVGEFVQQHAVGAGFDRLAQFVQRFDFAIEEHAGTRGARGADRIGDAAGRGNVVFLDQDRVVETHAVVVTAAAAHGVFLGEAQTRNGLAGVEDLRAGAGDRIGVAARHRGGAGKGLQEIERVPLARHQRARVAFHFAQHGIRGNAIAIAVVPMNAYIRIELAKALLRPRRAGKHRVLATNDVRVGARVGIDQRGGDIARTDVFGERARDIVADACKRRRCGPRVGGAHAPACGAGCALRRRSTMASSARSNSGTSSRIIARPLRSSEASCTAVRSATFRPRRLTNRYLPLIGLIHDSLARSRVPVSSTNSTQLPILRSRTACKVSASTSTDISSESRSSSASGAASVIAGCASALTPSTAAGSSAGSSAGAAGAGSPSCWRQNFHSSASRRSMSGSWNATVVSPARRCFSIDTNAFLYCMRSASPRGGSTVATKSSTKCTAARNSGDSMPWRSTISTR